MTECPPCGGEVPPSDRRPRKYCSGNCRKRAWDARNHAACQDCGGEVRHGRRTCSECLRTRFQAEKAAQLAKLERLWAEGLSREAIAAEMGWTVGSLEVRMAHFRAEGADLPYRRLGWKGFSRPTAPPRSAAPTRNAVRLRTHAAIRNGELARPKTCEACDERRHVDAHHRSYDRPDSHLDVDWLCPRCHVDAHRGTDRIAA